MFILIVQQLQILVPDVKDEINFTCDRSKETMLHMVTRHGYTDCMKILLHNGANADCIGKSNCTLL